MAVQDNLIINIEGEFIDSFIYSGTLLCVHQDSSITTHNWNKLTKLATKDYSIKLFLDDCRNPKPYDIKKTNLYITKEQLQKTLVSKHILGTWPTDICVFSNKLYVADENGVRLYILNWENNSVSFDKEIKIWDKYSFKIMANDGDRIAIASGNDGVVASILKRNNYSISKDTLRLVHEYAIDCDWFGQNLISNTSNGAFLSKFQSYNPDSKEYSDLSPYQKYLAKKNVLELIELQNTLYAWNAGNKLVKINKNNEIEISEHNSNDVIYQKSIASETDSFLSARSGLFGCIIEYDSHLLLVNEDEIHRFDESPISWRVFPRAVNYLNHLHIIDKDKLCIHSLVTDFKNKTFDYLGVDIKNLTKT